MADKLTIERCNVEMLFIINKNSAIGKTPSAFIKILEATEELSIKNDNLVFKKAHFKLNISEHDKKKEALFIKLSLKEISDENLLSFSQLIRVFRKVTSECQIGKIQLIWDDISKHYCILAYPLIYEIENLMRKLITKFMFINVGLSWTKTSIPEEFLSIRSSKSFEEHNMMYQIDFIQLTNFLFKAYREIEVTELIKKLSGLNFQDLDANLFSEIKKIVPQSNWEKYFSPHIKVDPKTIINNWEKLYALRCKIAHNRDFSKSDYQETINLTDKLIPILQKAIDKTEAISIDEGDRTELADQYEDNFLKRTKSDIEIFYDAVFKMYEQIRELYSIVIDSNFDKKTPIDKIIDSVFTNVIPDEKYTAQDVKDLISVVFDEENINKYDNFELHNLIGQSLDIREMIIDKIHQIETIKEESDEDN
ncbi:MULTISPECIES: HEPN domain-containing protein [Kosakonia]|uniref:HEPN domain-containing protein n=1 Tax=Kosakonia TaxID=1330547 RepID=UPI000698ACC5|nr:MULTISPECIES: HEPN domain-containing protein [Kosakonia]RCX06249.1 hypothetical protein DFO56_101388 [Kosakonia sp. AG348]